ncbi:TPA: hypothetical protein N0F65_010503 [Lagenidium giganteum]|uniref:Uncharacterized protein n=1 Tax=Lagenidium giganteum TaxID=4803 RepID=A0AAV2Z6R9_9STRA|nr:TPA: hypothetical protein N0F65_010503 [Lagenidium giganteum]
MGTVRTASPRYADDAKKPKGSGKKKAKTRAQSHAIWTSAKDSGSASGSSNSTSPVGDDPASARLAALEDTMRRKMDQRDKWQLCTQKTLSEMRVECMKVRRELEKMGETTDVSAMRVEDALSGLSRYAEQTAQRSKDTKATVKQMKSSVVAAIQAKEEVAAEMATLRKRVAAIAKQLQAQRTEHIDEEFLMTQLTDLQERFEGELLKFRNECTALDKAKKGLLEKLDKRITATRNTWMEQVNELSRRLTSAMEVIQALDSRMQGLVVAQQDGEYNRGRVGDELDSLRREVAEQSRRCWTLEQQQQHHSQVQPPAPGDDPVVMERLDAFGCELRRLTDDFVGFTKLMDARQDHLRQQLRQELRQEMRQEIQHCLQEFGKQVFGALEHDSRMHISENKRMRDTVFDLQADLREMGQRMHGIEDSLRCGPPPYPPRSPLPPLRHKRRRRDDERTEPGRPFRPYGRHDDNTTLPPSQYDSYAPQQQQWPPMPPPPPMDAFSAPPLPPGYEDQTPSVSHPPQVPNHGFETHHAEVVAEPRASELLEYAQPPSAPLPPEPTPAAPPPATIEDSGPSDRERRSLSPCRESGMQRIRRQRRPHEVIVIEDEGDDYEELPSVPPFRAPPEPTVEPEEPPSSVVRVRVEIEGEPTSTAPPRQSTDEMNTITALHVGFLMYVCFGGAPSMDADWSQHFAELKPDNTVGIERLRNFQSRYPALQTMPIQLSQFVLQVISSDAPMLNVLPPPPASSVGDFSIEILKTEFTRILQLVRRTWAEALNEYTTRMYRALVKDPTMKFSLNPIFAGDPTEDEDATAWLWQHAESLRKLTHSVIAHTSPNVTIKLAAETSPAVFVFLLMFDVLSVEALQPQKASFQLNQFGRRLMVHLWDRLLSKLPYELFVDCSWLDEQSDSSGKLPPIGFCHALASLLAWNSVSRITDFVPDTTTSSKDGACDKVDGYAECTRLLLRCLRIQGKPLSEMSRSPTLSLLHKQTVVELVDVDTKLAMLLQMDGFFEASGAVRAAYSAHAKRHRR